jgi:L-2,4-diaminobutyrate decarboxylase
MMLVPLAASVVLVRRESDLDAAFSQRAPYLFHGQDGERIRDQGIRSFQCSRRLDAFKVWVALQRHGARTFGALYDHLCGLAATLHGLIAARDDFDALHVPESNILCFRYVGDRGRPVQDLDGLNLALRQAYNREGDGWITTTVLDGARVLRVAIMNPRTTVADLQRVLDGLASIAKAERRSS